MQESAETPLGPAIKTKTGETKYPYQDLYNTLLKENIIKRKYSAIVVFGEGPPKKIIFSDEATEEERRIWENFTQNPLAAEKEPDFRITPPELHGITPEEEERNPNLREEKRRTLQKHYNYGKKRWGEMNATAAGYLLYIGATDRLILTGGRTGGEDRPSEASLMKDKIIRRFGELFFRRRYGNDETIRAIFNQNPEIKKQYGSFEEYRRHLYEKFIESELSPRIIVEDRATNTITNIVNITGLINEGEPVALLTSGHHLTRANLLMQRIGGIEDSDLISAQKVLEIVGKTRKKKQLIEIANAFQINISPEEIEMVNTENLEEINPDLKAKIVNEQKMLSWLRDDDRLSFWLPQVLAEERIVSNPPVLRRIFRYLNETPQRRQKACEYFSLAGLNFGDYAIKIEAGRLSPEEINTIMEAFKPLTDYKTHRQFPISELLNNKQRA